MGRKTHYTTLGVSRDESVHGIKAAYRDRAKSLHPDIAGEEGTAAFQELAEAYSVLSDPRRRHEYNEELRGLEEAEDIDAHREHGDSIDLELRLTPEELAGGILLAIETPVLRRCGNCNGSGYSWTFPCIRCGGHGLIASDVLVRVRIPPRTRPGTIVETPLAGNDIRFRFHVVMEAA